MESQSSSRASNKSLSAPTGDGNVADDGDERSDRSNASSDSTPKPSAVSTLAAETPRLSVETGESPEVLARAFKTPGESFRV